MLSFFWPRRIPRCVLTSIDRTAYPRFRGIVSARELVQGFTPTPDEAAWARGKTIADQAFLALVTWLKCYQRLRRFPDLEEVPAVVIDHIRAGLGLPDDVAAVVESARSAARYRDVIRERLGVKYEAADVRGVAEAAIRAAAATKDNPADLINVALEELLGAGRDLPGYSTLDRMVAKIRAEANAGVFATVAARITLGQRARLLELLVVDPTTRRSRFDRLKDPAKAATLGKFKDRLGHLADLDALGPTDIWLHGIPPGKISNFAGEAKVTDANDMAKVGDAKRLTLLATFVHTLRTSARDEGRGEWRRGVGVTMAEHLHPARDIAPSGGWASTGGTSRPWSMQCLGRIRRRRKRGPHRLPVCR